ncbi:MAG TPA: DUF4190 domain-containing protein [Tepidisphaeraceae bacterium]|jgi:hypothetical protein|nr:DUF4190 domain-containing protein [Tepidisphaeraceae bacterium]
MAAVTSGPTEILPMPRRGPWSIAALTGFACGLLLIVPFLAGITAIILGICGLLETRQTSVRGRKLALIGIVLGLVNLLGWSAYAGIVGRISAPGRSVAYRFIDDLSAGNTTAAERECDGIGEARLRAAAIQLKNWGGARSVAILYIDSNTANAVTTGSIRGTIHTSRGDHSFELTTASENSAWIISNFVLR